MLKLYEYFVTFSILWLFSCSIVSPCLAYGKWYKDPTQRILPIDGPLLSKNEAFENTVKRCGFSGGSRNILGDEKTEIFYINNFFPYYGDVPGFEQPILQLADILVKKKMLEQGELDKIYQIGGLSDIKDSEINAYIEAFEKFIQQGIVYLRAFDKEESAKKLQEIIDINKELPDKKKIFAFKKALSNAKTMEIVWDCMHTEHLLIFDRYYNSETKALEAPEEILVFVSYYDMCKACEALMEAKLSEMGEVRKEDFRGEHYKILVGSFYEYKGSRRRNSTESMLLKVPLSDTVAPSASAPISQPERKRKKPVVVIPPKIHTKTGNNVGKL